MRKITVALPMLLLGFISFAQQITVRGKISSKSSGAALEGVSVVSGPFSALSDSAGRFSILTSQGAVLKFSYVGMVPVEMKANSRNAELDIQMEEEANNLNTVVVTGYQTVKKKDLTGAVTVVNLAPIRNVPLSSPLVALQGQVPGLYVETDGSPAGMRRVLVRGSNTLGNTNPLYIIDGVPTKRYEDFAALSPGSIESVQILKDASASSIYGSRASNGVIIVTTQNGGNNRVSVQLNSSISLQTTRPWEEPVLDAEGRGRALWRAAVNDRTNPNTNTAIYSYDWNGDFDNPVLNKVNITPFVGGDQNEPAGNTNWQKEVFHKAVVTSNNLTVTAGNKASGILMDVGYFKNTGTMVYTDFERYSFRINSHTTGLNGKFRIGENLMISKTGQRGIARDVGGTSTASLAVTLPPTIPVYKLDGTFAGPNGPGYSDRNNPVHMQYLSRFNKNSQVLAFGNVYAELEPLKNLVIRTSFGLDYSDLYYKTILLKFSGEGPARATNSVAVQENKDQAFTWTNTVSYQKDFGKHRFNLLAGVEAIRSDNHGFGGYRENFAVQDEDYLFLNAGTGASNNNEGASGYRLMSQFGKLFYGFNDKYLASVTLRRDGSSRFGSNNKYGVFPAMSVGWRIDREAFMKSLPVISGLKLRAGVGRVGNQEIGDVARFGLLATNYGTIGTGSFGQSWSASWLSTGTAYDLYGNNGGTLPSGYVQIQAENPNLKWESTDEINVGLDFGFLENRLTGSFDYFSRKTTNILIQPPVASAVGEGQLSYFNGATKTNKGFEFLLNYQNSIGAINYSITATGTHFADKITALPEEVRNAYPGNAEQTILGHSQYAFFGYKTQGIFQNQAEVDKHADQTGKGVGRIRYADLNNDGKIDAFDQTWLGTSLPKLEYGININLGYKNFNLTIFGSGVAGKMGRDQSIAFNGILDTRTNGGPGLLDAWTPQHTNARYPALSLLNTNTETRLSDFLLTKANYFKLRNIQFGYDLGSTVAKALRMQSFRVYLVALNLFAVKSKSFVGKDPERANNGYETMPVPTTITFGINARF